MRRSTALSCLAVGAITLGALTACGSQTPATTVQPPTASVPLANGEVIDSRELTEADFDTEACPRPIAFAAELAPQKPPTPKPKPPRVQQPAAPAPAALRTTTAPRPTTTAPAPRTSAPAAPRATATTPAPQPTTSVPRTTTRRSVPLVVIPPAQCTSFDEWENNYTLTVRQADNSEVTVFVTEEEFNSHPTGSTFVGGSNQPYED